MNMLIGFGLEEVGELKRASLLKAQTNRAISENGFAEYFDPIDGSPLEAILSLGLRLYG